MSRTSRPATRRRLAGLSGVGLVAAASLGLLCSSLPASASSYPQEPKQPLVRHVSARLPVVGATHSLGALRPASTSTAASRPTPTGSPTNTWSTLDTLVGSVVHDVDFPTARIGYAAAELGQVWKTTDGGTTWTKVLNRGFPIYYYGVEALNRQTLVVSGFNNQTSQGILTWSHDGGATWGSDQVISPNAWVSRVRMPGHAKHGLAMNGLGAPGSAPNDAWYTSAKDVWNQVTVDPSGGWFGSQFTYLRDQSAYASGITYCTTANGGAAWGCRASIDSVFDGATDFVDPQHGWVGGGEISPDVAGWLHRTTDGGTTWSGRVLETAYPIRQIEFLDSKVGWAAGGNVYSGVGGISFTSDGGKTWVQDADTGTEVGACAHHGVGGGTKTRVWCIGFTFNGSQFVSTVYSTTYSPGKPS